MAAILPALREFGWRGQLLLLLMRSSDSKVGATSEEPPSEPTLAAHLAESQQGKMARAVLGELSGHRFVAPLREAGRPQIDGPVVGCHTRAVWASYGFKGAGEYQLEARIELPGWWEPHRHTFEDHAKALARYLAFELRRQWEDLNA